MYRMGTFPLRPPSYLYLRRMETPCLPQAVDNTALLRRKLPTQATATPTSLPPTEEPPVLPEAGRQAVFAEAPQPESNPFTIIWTQSADGRCEKTAITLEDISLPGCLILRI